jgi:hypothetical protein
MKAASEPPSIVAACRLLCAPAASHPLQCSSFNPDTPVPVASPLCILANHWKRVLFLMVTHRQFVCPCLRFVFNAACGTDVPTCWGQLNATVAIGESALDVVQIDNTAVQAPNAQLARAGQATGGW